MEQPTQKIYVAVLKRGIPVGSGMDTLTHVIRGGETVRDVMDWAERQCKTEILISVEIVEAT